MSRTVVEHLAERARTHPAQVALYIPVRHVKRGGATPHRSITFAELHADSDALASGLQSAGIVAGTRTALMVPPGLDFFSLTFALFKIGAVPVLIDPGMGMKNLGTCLAQAEPEAFIGSAKAHLARRLFGWAKRSVRTTVNAGEWKLFCTTSTGAMRISPLAGRASDDHESGTAGANVTVPPSLPPSLARPANGKSADTLAAILFTSGSTGIAKGVEYTHGIFSAQIDMLKSTYGIEPGEIDFCTFPLFALFGAALGMTCVVPEMDATRPARIDPATVRAQLRQFRCTNLFASPAVLKRLANEPGADPADYASVRRVISAGAPATPTVLEAFAKLLPAGVPIFTPYGATECLPVANISSAEILNETRALTEQGRGVCVGKPVAGMEVMVIPIADGAIGNWGETPASRPCQRSGEPRLHDDSDLRIGDGSQKYPTVDTVGSPFGIGEFVVRGPVVTPRYFRNPQATALAKIHDPITGETLHRMGDVGYIDEQGRLWFCGRKSHRVVTAHGTLFTDMVEPVFNTVEGVARTALVGMKRDETTIAVICVERFNHPNNARRNGIKVKVGAGYWINMQKRLADKAEQYTHTATIATFLDYPGFFPVDVRHNSKIFREKLAVWADKKLGPKWKGGPA